VATGDGAATWRMKRTKQFHHSNCYLTLWYDGSV